MFIISIQHPMTVCGLFLYRIYEEYHMNLYECSMDVYCYIPYSFAWI